MDVAAILKLKGRTVVTTTADKSLLDVAKLLTQHRIGCIVIEGDDGKVAGIVSERDLMQAIGQSGTKVLKEPVSVYMTKRVVTAREADTIDQADVGNDGAPMPPHARGRERPADRPRLHWRRGQDARRGCRV
jgi:CBS domain-containing protein